MSTDFIYNRVLSIYRVPRASTTSPAAFGAQGYQEPQTVKNASVWASVPVASGVRCSIQEYRSGQRPADDLPGSTMVTPTVKIFVPASAMFKGGVLVRDFLMDELGARYHVINPYWNSLGYRLYCVFLET